MQRVFLYRPLDNFFPITASFEIAADELGVERLRICELREYSFDEGDHTIRFYTGSGLLNELKFEITNSDRYFIVRQFRESLNTNSLISAEECDRETMLTCIALFERAQNRSQLRLPKRSSQARVILIAGAAALLIFVIVLVFFEGLNLESTAGKYVLLFVVLPAAALYLCLIVRIALRSTRSYLRIQKRNS